MLDCQSMYNICARMCAAMKNDGAPFGGINMIFASDFAQLPPAVGADPLYSHQIGQVTTVVILQDNMRQKSQSAEDAKLRTALENLRYRACTSEDIKLIQSCVAGKGKGRPKLNQPRFRNISIVTTYNAYRDKINELGSSQFAAETNQELVTFYSIDKFGADKEDGTITRKQQKQKINIKRSTNIVHPELQEKLWDLPHASTDHHPGKLSICIGLPVMLKVNEATECCVTNGVEATVVGWTSHPLGDDQFALDTLFMKLTTAPRVIQIPGLPENVIPLSHVTRTVKCILPSGAIILVNRDQVAAVPNFAMTDFASQGRTRPDNVIDMHNCLHHQSIFTCLSWGATLDGTIIVRPFDIDKLSGGIAGSLHQEFRDLELLDEITRLRHLETISPKWKGEQFTPPSTHNALKWSAKDPFPIEQPVADSPWVIVKTGPNAKGAQSDHQQKVQRDL
ncbi:hypothetical protein K466DRAFT_579259 [Polyporus arcularius HHB13444]|uniref:ATP-dependent DNA helicase n=1 Tax=Polyporus arcularius HHB13444 TaxID=1314778 RepID=A0A5C3NNP4_9APHY|nr:hypothetical protein K466DRAFT_579259 [Polyporus arcularius HHB13444]